MNNRNSNTTYTVHVPQDKAGLRLDKVLAEELPNLSRARLQGLIKDECVLLGALDGPCVMDAKAKTRAGEVYIVCVPLPQSATPEAQDIPLDVVFEDDDVIVIDKAPGMVVHPAAGNADGTLVNALLHHCRGSLSGIGGVARPGIVHRLDKGTGGLMIAAKNDIAHAGLSKQFADHSLDRAYIALVWGVPNPTSGEIEGNIGRSPQNRKKMAVVLRGGKYALTRYKVLKAFGTMASLVECRLATGRTHQIRVHMTSIGHPLLGDHVYGGTRGGRKRQLSDPARTILANLTHQALYACELGFIHPRTGEKILLKRDKPKYINDIVAELENI